MPHARMIVSQPPKLRRSRDEVDLPETEITLQRKEDKLKRARLRRKKYKMVPAEKIIAGEL